MNSYADAANAILFFGMIGWPLIGALGGYLPTFLIGIPLYLGLRRHVRPSALTLAGCGAFLAALPWIMIRLGLAIASEIAKREIEIDLLPTELQRLSFFVFIGLVAPSGAVTGLIFWWMVRPKVQRQQR